MIKKLVLIPIALISLSTFASVTTKVQTFDVPYVHDDTDRYAVSTHWYTINNNTSISQDYTICYDLSICAEWPYYIKTSHECENLTLQSGQSKSVTKGMLVNFRYSNLMAWCHIVGQTQVVGAEYSISRDDQKQFQIGK